MTALEQLLLVLQKGTNHIGDWQTVQAALAPIDDNDTTNGICVNVFGNGAKAFRQARDAALNDGHNHIIVPPGDYYMYPDDVDLPSYGGAIASIPSGFKVIGQPGCRIHQLGLGAAPDGSSPFYHVFQCPDGTSDVLFEGLTFVGDKPTDAYTYNHQSGCIDIQLHTSSDIVMYRNHFLNLWGFPMHAAGEDTRIHAIQNYMFQCANGMNINASNSLQMFNTIIQSEGIEFSGQYATIAFNELIGVWGVGISAGGDLLTFRPGSKVSYNRIIGCTQVDGQFGIGIIAAENFGRSSIDHNYITLCDYHGMVIGNDAGNIELDIDHNELYSNGLVGHAGIGMDVNGQRHSITHNKSRDVGVTGYDQRYGMILRASDCRVTDNDFKGVANDVSYSGSLRTLERNNRYETGNQEAVAGATFQDVSYAWRA